MTGDVADPSDLRKQRANFLARLDEPVSPPGSRIATPTPSAVQVAINASNELNETTKPSPVEENVSRSSTDRAPENESEDDPTARANTDHSQSIKMIPSPFKLTKIRDLPASDNVDTISLHDILGNPLIREAWVLNYCFDVDWMMQYFDPDIRDSVQVRVIHGSWKKEDRNRIYIEEACQKWKNVRADRAYLPDAFGTHHSKMFVLFTHDDTAEVIIHTANMLQKDWTNMAQAVWRSGPLPLLPKGEMSAALDLNKAGSIGSGTRFKYDLLTYLAAYKRPCQALIEDLVLYDFASVRGALVASVPAKIRSDQTFTEPRNHPWGYPQLREVVKYVSSTKPQQSPAPHLVAQVSSIATLPSTWFKGLVDASRSDSRPYSLPSSVSIIFPTAPNVAGSLDGYSAGGSIHTKAQSEAHLKQIEGLRPHLCQWARGTNQDARSGRCLAAPHIKTYVQYSSKPTKENVEAKALNIDWALVTSANLSTQAWGSLPKPAARNKPAEGPVHIQSFEIGVLVWPELFLDVNEAPRPVGQRKAIMVPVFGKDSPSNNTQGMENGDVVVGFRMPYDLPLTRYGDKELPWSPHNAYYTPDSNGMLWQGW